MPAVKVAAARKRKDAVVAARAVFPNLGKGRKKGGEDVAVAGAGDAGSDDENADDVAAASSADEDAESEGDDGEQQQRESKRVKLEEGEIEE